ncbi:hypothetical protein Anapl_14074 [Anas platyrhynchos]|uniref:Uncharacterized protein n=1 Tax=Anas platyrhynchos TaxID=8839 RepID=R0KZR7_ANAPL|nr:hypothetical protein Anapl_14074 [Anas platyrhynchos]
MRRILRARVGPVAVYKPWSQGKEPAMVSGLHEAHPGGHRAFCSCLALHPAASGPHAEEPRLVTSTTISLADGPCMMDPPGREARASTKVGLGLGPSVAALKEPAWIQHTRKVSTLFFKSNTI